MKKLSILPVLLLILALSVTAVSAAADVTLGSDIDENVVQKESFSTTLNVENTGDENLSITITIDDLEHATTSDAIDNIAIDDATFDLDVGANQDVTFSLTVDDDQELGEYTGTITVTYNNGTDDFEKTAIMTLDVSVGNHLIIDRIDMEVDGDDQRMDDGDRHDEDAKPRSTVTFEIRVENDFREDIEIEDIEVEVYADNDLDWDERDDIADLDRGDKDTITFTFDVPEADDIDDDTYDIEITVSGIDENGDIHEETWTLELRVKRERYDLELNRVSLSPSYFDCGDAGTTRITMTIENVGSKDVEGGTLIINSEAIKEEIIIRDIDVDEGDDITRTYTLPIRSDLQEGQYFIDLQLFTSSNSNDDTDVASTPLTVFACQTSNDDEEDTEEEESETEIEVITPTPTVPSTTGNVVYKASGTPSKAFFGSGSTYMILLIVIIVLLIVLIGVAIAALTKK